MSRAELTPKQAAFVREYLKSGNASKAYRESYDADGMKPEHINVEASKLLDNPKIAQRVKEFQDKANAAVGITLESHLARLAHLSTVAEGLDQISASVKAEELRGKVSGLYVERVEHSSPEPVVVTFRLARPNGEDPEAD